MWQVLKPERRVVFLDTDLIAAEESQMGGGISNAGEAAVLKQILTAFAASGVDLSGVGVVSPYRSQVKSPPGQGAWDADSSGSSNWPCLQLSSLFSIAACKP